MKEEKKKPKKRYKKWIVIGIITIIVIALLQVTIFKEMTLQKWGGTIIIAFACVGGLYWFIHRREREETYNEALKKVQNLYYQQEKDALNTDIHNLVGEFISPYYYFYSISDNRLIQYEPRVGIRSIKRISEDDMKEELTKHKILSEIARKKYLEVEEEEAMEKAGFEKEE